jgi:hypothetical protein
VRSLTHTTLVADITTAVDACRPFTRKQGLGMRRLVLLLGVTLLAMVANGCANPGVGDPCLPQHPPSAGPNDNCSAAGGPDAGCFVGTEVYIETRSLQCRTRVCMVFHWDEHVDEAARNQRVHCTCRCGGIDPAVSYCACPSGFACVTAFRTGEPGIIGDYCVRSDLPEVIRADAGR